MKIGKVISKLTGPFQALQNKLFAKGYLAQTFSLLGDAFTLVGLALLAYQLRLFTSVLVISYPIAGFLGTAFPEANFLYGGILTLSLLLTVFLFLTPKENPKT